MIVVLRVLVGLWAALFGAMAVGGLLDPHTYVAEFGLTGDVAALNTLRADFSAFFAVAAAAAGVAALRPVHARILWVPAALFGVALFGRALGVAMGDPISAPSIGQSMVVEAVSVILLLAARGILVARYGRSPAIR